MHMMGKRVNFAARSVISPDVNLATCEVALPFEFARQLTVREPVCGFNHDTLLRAVLNGAHQWPGANAVDDGSGVLTDLSSRRFAHDINARAAIARRLLAAGSGAAKPVVVYRHVRDGDYVLMNRQVCIICLLIRTQECGEILLRRIVSVFVCCCVGCVIAAPFDFCSFEM